MADVDELTEQELILRLTQICHSVLYFREQIFAAHVRNDQDRADECSHAEREFMFMAQPLRRRLRELRGMRPLATVLA